MDEVIKLLHIRCPLKVVIAYNYCDVRDNSKNDDRHKLIFVAKYRFYTKFDYRGYKYTDGQFMRLG